MADYTHMRFVKTVLENIFVIIWSKIKLIMNCGVVLNVTILEIKIGEIMESIEGRNVTDYDQLDSAIREVAKKNIHTKNF